MGEPLGNCGCSLQLVEPDVLLFDLSNSRPILEKQQHISRIVSVGPGLGIALCFQFFTLALLTWYSVFWGSALVTVGCASLPYLVWYTHHWKQLRCIPMFRDLPRKNIFWFDLWVWHSLCYQLFPLVFLTWYFVYWGSTIVTVGRAILTYLIWYRRRWKRLRCILNMQKHNKEIDDTWQLSPLKVGIIDPGISGTIIDINAHTISFSTTV